VFAERGAGGGFVSTFEFFFGFFSLIMGLAAVTLASGLAGVLKSRQAVKVGVLTPLLAGFMLMDISTFWAVGWLSLQDIPINYGTIYLGLGMTLTYFLAASLVFPSKPSEWPSLDDYYFGHKRLALGGVMVVNLTGLIFQIVWAHSDGFTLAQGVRLGLFFGCLAALIVLRGRRTNIALLVALCCINLTPVLAPALAAAGEA
jgi:hypothetical protein